MIYSGLKFVAAACLHYKALSFYYPQMHHLICHYTILMCPFAAPFQSIDPGQQFTWEHSNLEVNKTKNRYANVIAYDHTRVILSPIEGESSLRRRINVKEKCRGGDQKLRTSKCSRDVCSKRRIGSASHAFTPTNSCLCCRLVEPVTCQKQIVFDVMHSALFFMSHFSEKPLMRLLLQASWEVTTSMPTTLMATESKMLTSLPRARCRRRSGISGGWCGSSARPQSS